MTNAVTQDIEFRFAAHDLSDGIVRIITDANKFGLNLTSVKAEMARELTPRFSVTLAVPLNTSLEELLQRFGRHPTIISSGIRTGTSA